MTSDENIMSEMIERVVSRENSDELGVQMFCLVVRSNAQMIPKAQEMLISKIRSTNVTQSTRAIALLEECMSKSGTEFQDEVGKFRFLNELIRLVSKKYQGETTPTPIKQRIMECLLLWTTEFPQKSKIREAYDMLNKEQGSVEHGNSAAHAAKRENVLGIDEEMLSKLIHSNNPENFKRANLLIQYRVNQDSKRMELILQHKALLNEVQNTANLLSQMLDTYEEDGSVHIDGSDTMNLIRELYMSCKKHKLILQRLPELIENSDEDLVADTLETNEILQTIMKRYKDVVVHPPSKNIPTTGQTDLLSELLGIAENGDTTTMSTLTPSNIPNEKTKKPATSISTGNTLDELKEIFDSIENKESETKYPKELLGSVNILQPVNVFSNNENEKQTSNVNTPEKVAFRELREIDKISDELFKQNIQSGDRVGSFKKREPEKLSLNDLLREKTQVKPEVSVNLSKSHDMKIINEKNNQTCKVPVNSPDLNLEDDEMLSAHIDTKIESAVIETLKSKFNTPETTKNISKLEEGEIQEKPQIHLSEIDVDLDKLTPCGSERVLIDDEDIKITMNFTEDRPSKYVSVIVLAVSNKSKQALQNFQFEASVKKPCKVRLLPPTDNVLAPFKPYRPPTPINQVLLLLNPTGKDVNVTCIFGYTLGDDPDPIKESIVVKDISYVD